MCRIIMFKALRYHYILFTVTFLTLIALRLLPSGVRCQKSEYTTKKLLASTCKNCVYPQEKTSLGTHGNISKGSDQSLGLSFSINRSCTPGLPEANATIPLSSSKSLGNTPAPVNTLGVVQLTPLFVEVLTYMGLSPYSSCVRNTDKNVPFFSATNAGSVHPNALRLLPFGSSIRSG